jgi:hypothetical protein
MITVALILLDLIGHCSSGDMVEGPRAVELMPERSYG